MKSPVKSKTIWFNVVLGMIDVFMLGGQEHLAAYMSVNDINLTLFILGIIQAGGNVYLRYITSQPIGNDS